MENDVKLLNKETTVKTFPFKSPHDWANERYRQAWKMEYRKWWEETYKRFVPREWIKKGSYGILNGSQFDREPWSTKQIEAAINFDSWVAKAMGTCMKLEPEELALVFYNIKNDAWDSNENKRNEKVAMVIDSQKQKGMTDKEIEKSKKIMEELNIEKQIFYVK